MYKTVRQGDNCLQYHILPQDDVSSGHVMKRRRPPRSRTALVLVITLVLGCAIVAAAVLIPVLMRANVVALPARFQTFAVAASSVKMGGRGKYALQGTQYIALLPVKDSSGHFNAYQLKPSFHSTTTTSTTTTTTTTTASPPTTVTDVFRIPEPGARTGNNDPDRPQNTTPVETRGPERPLVHPYMPWMDHKSGAVVLSVGVLLVLLLAAGSLGLCLYLRRRHVNARRYRERDKGALLAEVAGEED